jgi:hypothetical protein
VQRQRTVVRLLDRMGVGNVARPRRALHAQDQHALERVLTGSCSVHEHWKALQGRQLCRFTCPLGACDTMSEEKEETWPIS